MTMQESRAVKVYMRVQNQDEVCIGFARTMSDVPRLLRELATLLETASPDSEPEMTQGTATLPPPPS